MTARNRFALVNVNVISMDPRHPEGDAIAWKAGLITAIGKEHMVLKEATAGPLFPVSSIVTRTS
jgi:predicted amidohydrolase YtcJ